jgi:hypothetical protein
MGDHLPVMVAQDTFKPGERGQNPFRAAAETGEKVGFDEAGQDTAIRLQEMTVDPYWIAQGCMVQRNKVVVVEGVMLETTVIIDDAVAQQGA